MADDTVNMLLEVVVLPVADADRSKAFYQGLGWRLDADINVDADHRIIQFTPPESPASIQFGTGHHDDAARLGARHLPDRRRTSRPPAPTLLSHGAEVSDVWHGLGPGGDLRLPGQDPGGGTYRSFATFADPDGNTFLLQQITERLPGRVWGTDVGELADLLHETSEHHGAFEAVAPKHDWWDWYAAYLDARQRGSSPDEAADGRRALHGGRQAHRRLR